MGLIDLLRPGVWWVRSESDPRWDASGEADVGLFAQPAAAAAHVEQTKRVLGEPPEDLEWGYHKY